MGMLRNLAKKIPFAKTVHRNSFFLLYGGSRQQQGAISSMLHGLVSGGGDWAHDAM